MQEIMERKLQAEKHVLALIHGLDPRTNVKIDVPGVLKDPEVMRSLLFALEAMREKPLLRREGDDARDRAGKPWSKDEDRVLVSAFQGGDSLEECMTRHRRGEGGILSRLVRLKLASNKYEARAAIGAARETGRDKMKVASS